MRLVFSLFWLILSSCLFAKPLTNIVVFGDSLSDNGNLYKFMQYKIPPSPPYYQGHFSNGPIWIEYLLDSYFPENGSAHLLNYAFGGAAVSHERDENSFTLKREIDLYLSGNQQKADSTSLFIVWIGSNNYMSVSEDAETTLLQVNNELTQDLTHLGDAGAKHILVLTIPDLGMTPWARSSGLQDTMSYFTQRHNELLARSITQLKVSRPDVDWLYFDVTDVLNDLFSTPAKYGFSNITDTCYDLPREKSSSDTFLSMIAKAGATTETDNCSGYLFFDFLHPTEAVHRIVAMRAREYLTQEEITFAR